MASQYTATGYPASMPCYAWLFSEVIDFAYKLVGLLKILTQLWIDLVKMMFAALERDLQRWWECKRIVGNNPCPCARPRHTHLTARDGGNAKGLSGTILAHVLKKIAREVPGDNLAMSVFWFLSDREIS